MVEMSYMDIPLFEKYLKEDKKKDYSDITIKLYVSDISRMLLSRHNFNVHDEQHYMEFLGQTFRNKGSIHCKFAVKAFIKYLATNSYITTQHKNHLNNIIDDVFYKKAIPPKRKNKHIPTEMIYKIISNMDYYKHQIIAIIQVNTAMRIRSVLTLKKGDIDWEYVEGAGYCLKVMTTKTKRNKFSQSYIIDGESIRAIAEYLQLPLPEDNTTENSFSIPKGHKAKLIGDDLDDYIFIDRKYPKSNIFTTIVNNNYKRYWADLNNTVKKMKIVSDDDVSDIKKIFSSHAFRANTLREFYEISNNIVATKIFANHSDVNTTMKYIENEGMTALSAAKELNNKRSK